MNTYEDHLEQEQWEVYIMLFIRYNEHKGDETFLNWKSNMRNVTLKWLDSNEKTYKILSNK
jgi:hypothetical protein